MAKQNNELLQRIKTLEDMEQKEYEDMGASMKNLQEKVKSLTQCLNQVKDFQHHHQLGMSPDLEQAEGMTTSISQRIQEIADFHESQHTNTRSALQQERESLKSLWESSSFQNSAEATEDRNTSQSTGINHQQNQNQNQNQWKIPFVSTQLFSRQKTATNTETQEQKSDLKMEEEKHLCQRIDMIEKNQQEQHQKIRYYLNQVEKEVTDVQRRICHIEATQQQKPFEIRLKEKDEELQATRSVHKQEEELKFFKDRLKEKDEELQATRSVLNKKEEELKSFKDRVALEVALSIKTGNTMSLNSPVSKNRIREMYETLRCDWPKIKEDLKLAGEKPDSVQKMILKQFTSSRTNMENKNMMISNFFELNKPRHGTESPEVKEYLLLAIQNLQLAIYNQKYDNDSQKPLSAHKVTNHKDMMEYLRSECYWLGCLMALNNPPINPDWENHPASMDKWDILPRNITAASVKKFAVYEKDEELESFKDRVAGDVASSIKTGKAINLNNPVSKPKIIELYEDLRQKWPKIKDGLKSKGGKSNLPKIRTMMEKVFNEAKAQMKQKMKQIDDVFELNTSIGDAENSKVKEYRQLTIQNLQLAIYSEKQQNPTPLRQCESHLHVVDYLKRECFWLGRLMALNDPPFEPDWLSLLTTCNKWDILPDSIIECQN